MRTPRIVILGIVVAVPGIVQAQTVLTCTGPVGMFGAPSYRIELEARKASLFKVFLNPTVQPLLVASSDQFIRYGRTTIFVADLGKSGYVLVYSSEAPGKSAAVIDINLATHRDLNTPGAVTGYSCRRPSP